MNRIVDIPLPLAHVRSVNAWLLLGEPVTLVDTGPRDDAALAALDDGLRRAGLRVEDIELVLATHHHLDHVGLAATIQRRSGATVAVLDRVADYAECYAVEIERDRAFAHALMAYHGVPDQVVADNEDFWEFIRTTSEDFRADLRLADGDVIQAGGRLLTGHGPPVTEHARLVEARLLDHHRRCERIVAILKDGPSTAYAIASRLWPARTVAEQPLLVVWEVIGHLELLLAGGDVAERTGAGGSVFELTAAGRRTARTPRIRPRAHGRPARAPALKG
jgi:ribonuclease BN (tRNA processing enzyme)